MPSRLRARARSASNSATIAKTSNSNRPTGSVGSWIEPPRLSLTCRRRCFRRRRGYAVAEPETSELPGRLERVGSYLLERRPESFGELCRQLFDARRSVEALGEESRRRVEHVDPPGSSADNYHLVVQPPRDHRIARPRRERSVDLLGEPVGSGVDSWRGRRGGCARDGNGLVVARRRRLLDHDVGLAHPPVAPRWPVMAGLRAAARDCSSRRPTVGASTPSRYFSVSLVLTTRVQHRSEAASRYRTALSTQRFAHREPGGWVEADQRGDPPLVRLTRRGCSYKRVTR